MDPITISSSAFYGVTPFTYIVTRISFIPSALGGSLPWSLLPLDTFLLSPEIATHTPYTPTHVPSFVPSSSCLAPSPPCLPCLTPFLDYSGGGIPIHPWVIFYPLSSLSSFLTRLPLLPCFMPLFLLSFPYTSFAYAIAYGFYFILYYAYFLDFLILYHIGFSLLSSCLSIIAFYPLFTLINKLFREII